MAQGRLASGTRSRRYADTILAALVLLMVGMMILPLPTLLLDVLIASNISIAVLMLLVALYISGGLEFTAFPTVLLVTTLYRLALNVSSTRLILLQADAGDVIDAFGHFVVKGNYVVGAVVFLILTLIQFLVVAKGSERVAEVGARFTLDAMPGKQMSIDAELRSGAIGQDEARQRRRTLQRETEFYGSMDGAMKFVKGDAIAGIVITIINIVGGLTIGVAMRGMSAADALHTYGLLTIGDGLVSQIPALLISTAAGLVVTRVSSEEEGGSLGSDIASQIFGNPKALTIASIFLLGLAVVPGMPTVPFLVLAIVFFTVSRRLGRAEARSASEPDAVSQKEAARESEAREALVPLVVPVSIDLGPALAARLLDEAGGGPLLDQEIPRLRARLFVELGVVLPGLRARGSDHLPDDAYLLSMGEVPVAEGATRGGMMLAEAAAQDLTAWVAAPEAAEHPLTGRPAAWVAAEDEAALAEAGITVQHEAAVVAMHLERAVQRRAQELVGLQETQTMLDQLERAYPALVRNVVPKPVSVALLAEVLRRLVEERVSVRPLREILEALAVYAPNERDPVSLTELVRSALKRQITFRHSQGNVLSVFMLDPSIEEAIRDSIQRTATGSYLAMPPDMAREVIAATLRECESAGTAAPLLLTQADTRRFVRRLLEVELPDVVVLSYQELDPEITVQPMGRISV